jgi:hypothetical protein
MLLKDFRVERINIDRTSLTYGPGREPLVLQTPELFAQYGLGRKNDSAWIELQVRCEDARAERFFEALLAIDNKLLQTFTENSERWTGQRSTRDQLYGNFKPTLRLREGDCPTVRLRVGGSPTPKVFDARGRPCDLSVLGPGTVAKYLVLVQPFYIPEAPLLGTSLRLLQAAVVRHEPQFAFEDEGESI